MKKNYVGFLITKIWQIFKHFSRALSWAQTSYFWRVSPESFFHSVAKSKIVASPFDSSVQILPLKYFLRLFQSIFFSPFQDHNKFLWRGNESICGWTRWNKSMTWSISYFNPILITLWFFCLSFLTDQKTKKTDQHT